MGKYWKFSLLFCYSNISRKSNFTYFNTTTNSFKEVKVPLILQNELVSTQTDLNPNDSTFEKV